MRGYVEKLWGVWDTELPRTRFVPGRYQLVNFDGEDIGCMDVRDEDDHLQLNILYLLPQAQNRGIGTFLVRELLARADVAKKPARLKVFRPNPARYFYERLGFAVVEAAPERFYMERSCPTI